MKRLLSTTLCLAALAAPALAAERKQEVTIDRGSAMDQVSGLIVQGNSIVLVYGPPGMGASNQAVRVTPDGMRLRVVYDTVGNLGINTAGLQPAMMLGPSGGAFPVYNMGGQGAN
ncbi:hypothetical protein [Elioraea rosea]|uniref:hypothetical protein n=1 Tax=Elioraea rosea TaxID=2492390 RepID=UPI00118227EB|nr:hypothetical protein [Elioraea rosea]